MVDQLLDSGLAHVQEGEKSDSLLPGNLGKLGCLSIPCLDGLLCCEASGGQKGKFA